MATTEEVLQRHQDIIRQRHLDIEALMEMAEQCEEAATHKDSTRDESTFYLTKANNFRLRALCLDGGGALLPSNREGDEDDEDE